jgi:hypothetical protein
MDVELTDDIKQFVLDNRVYRPPPQPSVTTIINHNTMVNNYIASLDTLSKLDMVLDHNNLRLKSLDDQLSDQFEERRERLESQPPLRKDMQLDVNELLKTIDVVSRVCNSLSEFNLMIDSKNNKLRMYNGQWDEHLLDSGMTVLMYRIQEYYWDDYEEYLIKQIHLAPGGMWEANRCQELLMEYYKFLACFQVDPNAKNKTNMDLGVGDDHTYETSEQLMSLYRKLRDELKTGEIRACRNKVLDILKRSTTSNVDTLNCKVLQLFNMDPAFKQRILSGVA